MKYYYIKKLNVEFISLVDRPANKKDIIYKSENIFQRQLEITKKDTAKRIVYGIVYSPNELDLQNMFTDAKVIEEAAYNFLKNGNTKNIDSQHNLVPDVGFVCESWIVKKNDPIFQNEAEGSWAIGIKILKDEIWEKIIKGEIKGISLYGVALLEEKSDTSLFNQLVNKISNYFNQKNDVENNASEDIIKLFKEIENIDIKILKFETLIKDIEKRLAHIEKSSNPSVQPNVLRKKNTNNFWI